jgi:GTPase SAR1 family protein
LWDTAGQEELVNVRFVVFPRPVDLNLRIIAVLLSYQFRTLSYDDTHVFLVAFSCASKESLVSVKTKVLFLLLIFMIRFVLQWVPELKQYGKDGKLLMVLVGTKVDLRDSTPDSPDNCTNEEVFLPFLLFLLHLLFFFSFPLPLPYSD